ncbi:hypothetical protein [Halosimplex sp. J119]
MTGAEEDICELLSEAHIPHEEVVEHSDHIDKLIEIGEQLLKVSGVDDEKIYRNVTYDVPGPITAESGWGEIEVDIVTSSTISSAPHAAIYATIDSESDGMARYSDGLAYGNQLLLGTCGTSTGANIDVLLSNEYIAVSIATSDKASAHDLRICPFDEITEQFYTELAEWLSPPDSYPSRDPGPLPSTIETWKNHIPSYERQRYPDLFETSTNEEYSAGTDPNQSEIDDYSSTHRLPSEISTQHYELDLEEYRTELKTAEGAETSAEKGGLARRVLNRPILWSEHDRGEGKESPD